MKESNSLAFLIDEPAEVYHAKAKGFLTSHRLADFRKCPLLYHHKQLGLVIDEDRPAYQVGHATHTMILEGRDRFKACYAVGGPVNPKTGQVYGANTKAYTEWADSVGKPVLTDDQFELVSRMYDAAKGHPLVAGFLNDGVAEGVLRTDHRGLPCQARIDWYSPNFGIVDLKTCDDLTWFEADARRFGYVHQLAFYRSVLAQATGQVVPVHFIAVEKRAPFRCGVWLVDTSVLSIAQQENNLAMEQIKRCCERNHWPTGYEEVRVFDRI